MAMSRQVRGALWIASVVLAGACGSFFAFRPDRIFAVGAGLAAHEACSFTFVSHLPTDAILQEQLRALAGRLYPLIRHEVDRQTQTASASLLGIAQRRARYTPGYGCRLEYAVDTPLVPLPETSHARAPALPSVAATNPRLAAAIDRVFAEQPNTPLKAVEAVVVMIDGQVVGERYATGIGPDTPLPSWSAAKSLTNAILGVLVRDGKLRVDQPARAPEWMKPGDGRAEITIEQLLRMTSGLDADESGAPTDPVARMEFTQPDMAAFAAGRPLKNAPGTRWEYTSANTLILDRLLGQQIGGGPAGMRSFVQHEIAAPLGITSLTMEVDGAGTFVGSSFAYATARDYARFGQLYLDDGVAPNGVRILPEGWAAWSRRATLGSSYGGGFWTNDGGGSFARRRIAAGFPADGFYASGVLGQRIYIVPSARLVIVRLGNSMPPDFGMDDDLRLIAAAIDR